MHDPLPWGGSPQTPASSAIRAAKALRLVTSWSRATPIRVLSHPDVLPICRTINQTVHGVMGQQTIVAKPLFVGPIDLDHDRFTLHQRLEQVRDLPPGVLAEA